MQAHHQKHPHYGWDTNKGYPTAKHREAIMTHGAVEIHRKTFALYPKQLALDL
jgi:ribonuclease HII